MGAGAFSKIQTWGGGEGVLNDTSGYRRVIWTDVTTLDVCIIEDKIIEN